MARRFRDYDDFDRDFDRNRRSRRRVSGYYPGDFGSDYQGAGYFGGGSVGYGRGYERDTEFSDRDNFGGDFERDRDSYQNRRRNRSFDRDYDSDYNSRIVRSSDRDYAGGYYGRDYDSDDYDDYNRSRYYRDYDYDAADYDRDDRGFFDKAGDEVASWFGDDDAARRRRRDAGSYESHRGKGPKGYRRSDNRIEEDVNDNLSHDHFLDATDIEISVEDGEITLDGNVRSRSDKRRAEDIAHDVSGVGHVQNNLRVKKYDDRNAEYDNSGFTKSGVTSTNANPTIDATDAKGKGRKKSAGS